MALTVREAAIVSAYTGFLIGEFHEVHRYVEEILGRPVQTLELASDEIEKEIHEKAQADFCAIPVQ